MKKNLVNKLINCFVLLGCLALSAASAIGGEASELPDAIPAGAPFPSQADLNIDTMQMSGAERVLVSFTFSGDAQSVYQDFKDYLVNNGYSIELERDRRLSARGEGITSCVVDIQDMGSINVGTVTFTLPAK